MEDSVRKTLSGLIRQYGRAVVDDPKRCEGLLKDYCGQYRLEFSVLLNALKEKIPAELCTVADAVPWNILSARLVQRLCDNLGLTEESSRWAVESWAIAFGMPITPYSASHTTAGPDNSQQPARPSENHDTRAQAAVQPDWEPQYTPGPAPSPSYGSQPNHGASVFWGVLAGVLILGGLIYFATRNSTPVNDDPTPTEASETSDPGNDPQPTEPADTANSSTSRWPWTAEREVAYEDLQGLSKGELDIMRNEIYARHGWIFKRADLQDYFNNQSWYQPAGALEDRDSVNAGVLGNMTELEKQNAEKIRQYEASH